MHHFGFSLEILRFPVPIKGQLGVTMLVLFSPAHSVLRTQSNLTTIKLLDINSRMDGHL